LATPPAGTVLSLGKLGRATAVGNSDYTTITSLNDCARDSGTATTNLSNFYVATVDNALDGYPYVDEQTNENYEITFTDSNTLFDSRIKTRSGNFTWTTTDSDLFELQSSATRIAQYNAGAILDNTTPATYESNLVTNPEFEDWASAATPDNWTKSGTVSENTSGATGSAVEFETDGAYIEQSFTVQGNSTYEINLLGKGDGDGQIILYVSGAFHQHTYSNVAGDGDWLGFREDFYTSGSVGVTQTLKLKLTGDLEPGGGPLLDTIKFRRWEGAHMSDTNVTITGKYHDDGQSDGFNDHATRYNTAISKVVEIQDTYGGLAIACFLPGTKIQMQDGSAKLIENVDVGDEVLSVILPGLPDEDLGYLEWKKFKMRPVESEELIGLGMPGHPKLQSSWATVENVFYDYIPHYYNINEGFLKVTAEHDIWSFTGRNWGWNTPYELQIGNKVLTHEGEVINIYSIEKVEEEVEVINFDVEPLDIYFAGGVLVHNKGASSEP
jgi:hypothetical protein